jgi:TatD DNase family protein
MSDQLDIRGYDFHCHIDLYPDPAAMVAQCEKDRVVTFAVTTTPKAWPHNRKWTATSQFVHAAPGLHPELVAERYGEIALLEEYMADSRLVGEVGLDGSPQHRKSWPRQQEVFVRVLKRAQALGERVISIHSRRAANEVVQMIAEHTTAERTLCILHWFSGSVRTAQKAAALGCYFSVNHRMLEHDRGLALVRSLPEERLLTETDGPFTSQGDRKSVPADVLATTEQLAVLRNVSPSDMRRLLSANARHVLVFGGVPPAFETPSG